MYYVHIPDHLVLFEKFKNILSEMFEFLEDIIFFK